MTRASLGIVAIVLTIAWSGTAFAVYQETDVQVTDQGKPVPEQTVTLTVKEKDPKQPEKPAKVKRVVKYKTSRDGKIVVKIDDEEKKRPDIIYDVKLETADGRERVMRDITYATLTGGALDFTNVTVVEAPRTGEPPRQPRTGRSRPVQPMQPVEPVSYIPSGWVIVLGGNVGGGQSRNRYEDFPVFDGNGAGGGAFLAARYVSAPGFFLGPEIGVMGLNVNSRNPDGAFSNIGWMTFEGGQFGFSHNRPGSTPFNVYVGAGAAQAGFKVGIDNRFVFESRNRTIDGWTAHVGLEVQPAPRALPNLWVGIDYRYSHFDGRIGVDPVGGDLNFFSATMSYQFPVKR